jgi:hypothetical protein
MDGNVNYKDILTDALMEKYLWWKNSFW